MKLYRGPPRQVPSQATAIRLHMVGWGCDTISTERKGRHSLGGYDFVLVEPFNCPAGMKRTDHMLEVQSGNQSLHAQRLHAPGLECRPSHAPHDRLTVVIDPQGCKHCPSDLVPHTLGHHGLQS